MFNNNQTNGDYGKEGLSQESEISSILSQETMKLLELGCGDPNLPINLTPNLNPSFQSPYSCYQQNISSYETELPGLDPRDYQRVEFEAAVSTFHHHPPPPPPHQLLNDPTYYHHSQGDDDPYKAPVYSAPFGSATSGQHTELGPLYQRHSETMAPPVPSSNQNYDNATNFYDSRDSSFQAYAAPQVCLPFHQLALSDGCQIVEPLPFTPSNKKFPGIYDFDIIYPPPGTLNSDFMYSAVLNKLFIKQDTTCSFRFRLKLPSNQPVQQHPFRLRALPLFKELGQCHIPVSTCPLHPNSDTHRRSFANGHLILSDDINATYELDPNINRRSVRVPLLVNDLDADNSIKVPLKFACFSSCVGGINRRQLQIIFTLERGNEPIGRTTVDVRICAAPLRDIKKEENLPDPQRKKSYVTTREVNSRGSKRVRLSAAINSDYSPASNNSNSSDALSLAPPTYTIIVSNHELYEVLKGIKESFELCETGASNHILQYSKGLTSHPTSKQSSTSDDRTENNAKAEKYPNGTQDANRNACLNLSTKELYDMTLEIAAKVLKAAWKIHRRCVDFEMFRDEDEPVISQVPRPFLKSIIDIFVFWARDFAKIKSAYNISLPASLSSETSSTEKNSQESRPSAANAFCDNHYYPLVNRIRQPAWPSDFTYIVYQYRFRHSIHLRDDRANNQN